MNRILKILIFALMGVTFMNCCKEPPEPPKPLDPAYDPLAVKRINDLIANNGLKATPDAPETWTFATWNDETPKQLIELELIKTYGYMKGEASFAGLNTLQKLNCSNGYLTKIDLTNCTQLQGLFFNENHLTEIDLTSCTKLRKLACTQNRLTKLNVTNCLQLQLLFLDVNCLIELDLTGLNNLTDFYGYEQHPPAITLYQNEADEYICNISLNNPTFENSAISYSDGILKSTDSNVLYTYFTVQTNKEGFELSGGIKFSYSTTENH
jgi:Leucine-rich repeat (LRR) protein